MKERRASLSLFPSSPARISHVPLSLATTTATAAKTSVLKSFLVFQDHFNTLTECVLCLRLTSSFGCYFSSWAAIFIVHGQQVKNQRYTD